MQNFVKAFELCNKLFHHALKLKVMRPVAEFSMSICSTSKFICSSDDGVPRLLITEYDSSYKSNIYKNRMM